MLERVPFDKLDFKPHPRSMPLGQLAFMVGSMPGWFMSIIEQDFVDTAAYKQPPQPKNAGELVQGFERGVQDVKKALAAMDEQLLKRKWALKVNGKVMMELPRDVMLRQTVNHLVHHRAQLGVYLKMNGVPHPALYGASGDEH
jgi:uncharacterized damage-inducible protein DinB